MSIGVVRKYDDRIEMAFDSQATREDDSKIKLIKGIKIFERLGFCFTGESREIKLFENYINKNPLYKINDELHIYKYMQRFDGFLNKNCKFNCGGFFLIVNNGKIFYVENIIEVLEVTDYEAIGTGSPYGKSAMYLGHDVEDAVKSACEFDLYCSKPITKIIFKL